MGNGTVSFWKKANDAAQWLAQSGQAPWKPAPAEESTCPVLADPCGIAAEELFRDGVLSREEWDSMDLGSEELVDPEEYRQNRYILLTMAYERSNLSLDPEYQRFLAENGWWLRDCALFLVLDGFFGGQPWQNWPEDIRLRCTYALDHYRREFYFDAEFQMYLQYLCHRQRSGNAGRRQMEAVGICQL